MGKQNPLIDELDRLQAELTKINPGLKVSDAPKSLEDSKKTFADPGMLSLREDVRIAPSDYVSPADSAYSDNALQAAFNIAEHMKTISSLNALNHLKNKLKPNFVYLESTWVPKVIDEKTYQASIAFNEFINTVLTDSKVQNELPSVGKSILLSQMETIRKTLSNRLKVYEAHRKEQLEQAVRYLTIRPSWETELEAFRQSTDPDAISEAIQSHGDVLAMPISSDEEFIRTVEKALAEQEQLLENLKRKTSEFTFPEKIISSDFIRLLANSEANPEEIKRKWLELFNPALKDEGKYSTDITLYDEEVSALSGPDYQVAMQRAKIAEEHVAEQILQLKSTLDEALSAQYQEKLKHALDEELHEIIAPEAPEFLDFTHETPVYHLSLSDESNEVKRLEADKETYENLIDSLQDYQQKLKIRHQRLLDLYDKFPSSPTGHETFKKAREIVLVDLLSQADAVINTTVQMAELISQAQEELNLIEKQLATQSGEGRARLLEADQTRINDSLQAREQARERLTTAKSHLEGMTDPDLSELEGLNNQAKERRETLNEAKVALARFHQSLSENTSLYVPSAKIPQAELKARLECNEQLASFIDELYAKEQQASGWYGINLSNFMNRVYYHMSILGPNEFDLDMAELLEIIEAKQESIENELAIDITQPGTDSETTAKSPGHTNLHNLQEKYQRVMQPQLAKAQQEKLVSLLETQQSLAELDFLQAKIQHVLHDLEFQQADFNLQQLVETTGDSLLPLSKEAWQDVLTKNSSISMLYVQLNTDLLELISKWEALNAMPQETFPERELQILTGLSSEFELIKTQKEALGKQYSAIQTLIHSLRETQDQLAVPVKAFAPGMLHKRQEPAEPALESNKSPLIERLSILTKMKKEFFGNNPYLQEGVFGQYLKERGNTYYIRDTIGSLFFGDKSEAKLRIQYLKELQEAFNDYRDRPDNSITYSKYYDALMEKIDDGLQHFHPRASSGLEYEKTLHARLIKFRDTLAAGQDECVSLEKNIESNSLHTNSEFNNSQRSS